MGSHVDEVLADDMSVQSGKTSKDLDEPSVAGVTCFLCLDDPNTPCTKKHRGVPLHKVCYEAARCHNRLLTNKPQELEAREQLIYRDPEEWRRPIKPLIAKDGKRNQMYQKQLKAEYNRIVDEVYDEDEVVEEVPLQTWAQFLNQEAAGDDSGDSQDTDDLRLEWESKLAQQKTAYGKDYFVKGEPALRVGESAYTARKVKGTGIRKQIVTNLEPAPGARPASSVAMTCKGEKRKRSSSQSLMDPSPASSKQASGSSVPLTPAASGSAKKPRKPRDPKVNVTCLAKGSGSELTSVQFLTAKQELTEEFDNLVKLMSGKGSLLSQITGLQRKLAGHTVEGFDRDPNEIVSAITSIKQEVVSKKEKVAGCRKEDVQSMAKDLELFQKRWQAEIEIQATQCVDAMKHQSSVTLNHARAERMRVRYAIQKWSDGFVSGGFGVAWGKRLGDLAYNAYEKGLDAPTIQQFAGDKFEPEQIMWWKADAQSALAKNMMTIVTNIQGAHEETVERKMTVLNTAMGKPQNKDWTGSVTKLNASRSFDVDLKELGPVDSDLLDMPGYSARMYCFKPLQQRIGLSSMILVGFPSLVQALSDNVMLMFVNLHKLSHAGISMSNVLSFMSSDSAPEFESNGGVVYVKMTKGAVCFVPVGMLCIPIFAAQKPEQPGWAHIWAYPIMNVQFASFFDPTVLLSIVNFARHFFDHNENRMNTEQSLMLEKFIEKLAIPSLKRS